MYKSRGLQMSLPVRECIYSLAVGYQKNPLLCLSFFLKPHYLKIKSNEKKHTGPIKSKRDKDKVEITGEAGQVRWQIWFDLVSSRLLQLAPIILLLCILPKAGWVTLAMQWLKKQKPFLIFFVAAADFLMMGLSG